jgi:hypothetical protein
MRFLEGLIIALSGFSIFLNFPNGDIDEVGDNFYVRNEYN